MKREDVNVNIFKIMFFSIFLISFYIRKPILNDFSSPNIIFLMSLIFFIIINKNYLNMKYIFFITTIIFYIAIQDYFINNNPILEILVNISMYIVPMYVFLIDYKAINIKETFKAFLKLLNIFTIIIFFIGIFDPIIKFSIMRLLGKFLVPELNSLIISNTGDFFDYRYTSFLGHALFTKEIFIYFYVLNDIYSKKIGEELIAKNLVVLVSLIGILLTGSKTGILIILIYIISSQFSKIKFKEVVFLLLILLFAYKAGFFESVLNRFAEGDLTTGRNAAWTKVLNSGFDVYRIFAGYGEEIYSVISGVVGRSYAMPALEYPIVLMLLKYGVICTILIVSIIFIHPIVYFLTKKQYYVLVAFIAKLIDVNTYNGLIFKADNMILFVIFTYILMGVCNIGTQKNQK